jgi:hypothetical protein
LVIAIVSALIFAIQPFAAELIGRWEVQHAADALRLPDGWTRSDPPVIQVPRRGFVLLSVVYRRPGNGSANLRDFIDLETSEGWRSVGGAPDLSTAVLEKNDLSLGCAVLQSAGVVRVELSRFVATWW